jgi:hypothetical protein
MVRDHSDVVWVALRRLAHWESDIGLPYQSACGTANLGREFEQIDPEHIPDDRRCRSSGCGGKWAAYDQRMHEQRTPRR